MRCEHWIGSDATGRVCGVVVEGDGLPFCPKHLEVQARREAKRLESNAAKRARADEAWLIRNAHMLPVWRTQLERAEAEYARRTGSPATDRAAFGGDMSAAAKRSQAAVLSDSNVIRVNELLRIIERLRSDIARAERGR